MAEVATFGADLQVPSWSAQLTSDRAFLAVASENRTVLIYDVLTQEALQNWTYSGSVYCVDFSPDGHVLATACQDGWARVVDVRAEPIQVHVRPEHGLPNACAMSPDGNHMLVGCWTGGASYYDLRKPEGGPLFRTRLHKGSVTSICIAPDGGSLWTGSDDGSARVWDAVTGEARGLIQHGTSAVRAVAVGRRKSIVITGASTGNVHAWDIHEQCLFGVYASGNLDVLSVSCAWSNTFVAAAAGPHVHLWDWERRQFRRRFSPEVGTVTSVNLSKDGTLLAACGQSGPTRLYLLWDKI